MQYNTEMTDSSTGEISRVSLGDWITITEYGQRKGLGPRNVRTVLSNLGILQDEIEDCTPRSASFEKRQSFTRRRLTAEAIRQGLGRRQFSAAGRPFDVLSPKGQEWLDERWEPAVLAVKTEANSCPLHTAAKEALTIFVGNRSGKLDAEGQVRWLLHHFRDLQQVDISRITGASTRMVSHYVAKRDNQIRKVKRQRDTPLRDDLDIRFAPMILDPQIWSDTR